MQVAIVLKENLKIVNRSAELIVDDGEDFRLCDDEYRTIARFKTCKMLLASGYKSGSFIPLYLDDYGEDRRALAFYRSVK